MEKNREADSLLMQTMVWFTILAITFCYVVTTSRGAFFPESSGAGLPLVEELKEIDLDEVTPRQSWFLNQPFNINRADKDSLILIKGIGPKTADKIIAYRQEYGDFTSFVDLTNIAGIGDKKAEKFSLWFVYHK